MLSDEAIARVCHEANRALQNELGEPCPSEPWDTLPLTVRASLIRAVAAVVPGRTPEEQHNLWMRDRIDAGWVHGPVRNEAAKEHPCLVDYEHVSMGDRLKDMVFLSLVGVLRSGYANTPEAGSAVDSERA
jgi:RyR domain-containing protein